MSKDIKVLEKFKNNPLEIFIRSVLELPQEFLSSSLHHSRGATNIIQSQRTFASNDLHESRWECVHLE